MAILVEVENWGWDYKQSIAPSNPVYGTTWLDTSSDTYQGKVYTGSAWVTIESISSPGDIGVFGGGRNASNNNRNTIMQVTISSPGNASNFGDLNKKPQAPSAASNGTNDTGIFGGGQDSGYNYLNTIDQVTISSPGNATDFGDCTEQRFFSSATSNGTSDTGIFGGGYANQNSIDQITISSPGNATDFGDLISARKELSAISNGTFDTGIFGGGEFINRMNTIDQVTISSPGNATDFGDLTGVRENLSATSNGTSDTGIFGGGRDGNNNIVNIIDQVTISSAGNASDFGDLTVIRAYLSATSNGTSDTGIFGGGSDVSNEVNIIDQVTISSLGNATDFGDLTAARSYPAATSNGLL